MSGKRQYPTRNAELAKIHIAKKQLGMDEDTYRDMLFAIARVRSAKDLDHAGRHKVLDHLRAVGFKAKHSYPGRPHNINSAERGRLLKKIEAQLAEAKRPWNYAHAMARHMFRVDKLEFCQPDQLHRIVAALAYDARRHGREK